VAHRITKPGKINFVYRSVAPTSPSVASSSIWPNPTPSTAFSAWDGKGYPQPLERPPPDDPEYAATRRDLTAELAVRTLSVDAPA